VADGGFGSGRRSPQVLRHGLGLKRKRRARSWDLGPGIAFEQIKPDYLLWGCFCFRWSFSSASTPAGCLLQLIHGTWPG
jgi:hypothetical protein